MANSFNIKDLGTFITFKNNREKWADTTNARVAFTWPYEWMPTILIEDFVSILIINPCWILNSYNPQPLWMFFVLVLDNLKQTRDISVANEIHVYSVLITRGDSRCIILNAFSYKSFLTYQIRISNRIVRIGILNWPYSRI